MSFKRGADFAAEREREQALRCEKEKRCSRSFLLPLPDGSPLIQIRDNCYTSGYSHAKHGAFKNAFVEKLPSIKLLMVPYPHRGLCEGVLIRILVFEQPSTPHSTLLIPPPSLPYLQQFKSHYITRSVFHGERKSDSAPCSGLTIPGPHILVQMFSAREEFSRTTRT